MITNKFKKLNLNTILDFLILKISILIFQMGIKLKIYKLTLVGYFLQIVHKSDQNSFFYLKNILQNKNKKFIILLQKDGFNQDTAYIKRELKNFDSIYISRKLTREIAYCFFNKDIDDNSYQIASHIQDRAKKKCFDFYNYLFYNLPNRIKPKGILTGNFGYFAEQELFKAATKNNIKAVAIHKECIKSNIYQYIYSVRRSIFSGSMVLVYNEIEKELQINTGVVDLKNTKIRVTGCPRIDNAHSLRKKYPLLKKHKVILFGFGLLTGMPIIPRKSIDKTNPHYEYLNRNDKKLSWARLINKLCNSFYETALHNPEIEFLIKLKATFRDSHTMLEFFQEKEKLNNLKILQKGNSIDLLVDSSIAIGFNTTCIFEAIARGIPVIVPNFGECLDNKYKNHFTDLTNSGLLIVNSEIEMIKKLSELLNQKPKVKTKLLNFEKDLLNKWVGNSDGKANDRMIYELKEELS